MSFVGITGRWDDRWKAANLVELTPSLDVHRLYREGAFLEGAGQIEIRVGGRGTTVGGQPARLEAGKFWIGDQPISLRWHPQLPQRLFGCPKCNKDCRILFLTREGRWRCRSCAGLKYASKLA